MLNRPAVILSFGMLLEKVDTNGFIGVMLKKSNADMSKIGKNTFTLSEQFNLGEVSPEDFKKKLLENFGMNGTK